MATRLKVNILGLAGWHCTLGVGGGVGQRRPSGRRSGMREVDARALRAGSDAGSGWTKRKEIGARLIITHHPVMFRGRKNLREDDPEGRLLCELIREGIVLIAMHTNYDIAHPGVNDALASAFGLRDVRTVSVRNVRGRFERGKDAFGICRTDGIGVVRRSARLRRLRQNHSTSCGDGRFRRGLCFRCA